MAKTQTPVQFFFRHAGYSYDPKTETKIQGRWRIAKAMAEAERVASERGYSFVWDIDQNGDSSDWRDDIEPYPVWSCLCLDESGEALSACGGIDFGPDGEPWDEPYRRVMEAELASEAIAEADSLSDNCDEPDDNDESNRMDADYHDDAVS